MELFAQRCHVMNEFYDLAKADPYLHFAILSSCWLGESIYIYILSKKLQFIIIK